MWPFSKKIISVDRDIYRDHVPLRDYAFTVRKAGEYVGLYRDARKEIADLKASNERLADALAAAKERAGDA